jgi:amino acid adenylation domain-containing protein
MKDLSQQIANLTPEQRSLFEQKLRQKGIKSPQFQLIAKRGNDDHLPLSFSQQRLWFVQQLEPDNYSYNMASAFQIKGKLNVTALEKSFNEIVKRHETLRTTFDIDSSKQPRQIINPYQPFELPIVDVTESEIKTLIEREFKQPFDLTQSLLRVKLLKVSEDNHILLLTTHHIICDRWSIGLFLKEMTLLYGAFNHNQEFPLSNLTIQYADWAIWQRQQLQESELNKQINYWQQQLQDISVLELPTDHKRPPIPSYKGAQYPLNLPRQLSDQLKQLSSQEGVTLFTLLLTAFKVLLHRYTHQNDIVVGTELANRNRQEVEPLIGLFVNTLVLRTNISGNETFQNLLKQVREVTLSAFSHQDVPFEKIVEVLNPERNLSQMIPLFQVKFDFQLVPIKSLELPDLSLEHLSLESNSVKYELRFNLQETEDGINGLIEYSTDLFEERTIQAMVEHWQVLLTAIVQNPTQKISAFPLLLEREKQLLNEWNQTQVDYPTNLCIHHLFEAQAKRNPDAIAVIERTKELTYQELNQKANQLADDLSKKGIKPEDRIGICLDRDSHLIVSILAILKSGAAYVPLDPNYPLERIKFIIEDANCSLILTQEKFKEILPQNKAYIVDINTSSSLSQPLPELNNIKSPLPSSPHNLAYIIYTSGSTGRPKGVAIEHRNTVQFLHWAKDVFNADQLAGVLASTSICFDLSIFEIFVPLSWGGTVILAENILALPTLATADQVTLINTVPSAINQLIQTHNLPSSVQTINLAGEALHSTLVQQIEPLAKIYNLYGPSEDTTYSTYGLVHSDSVSIGSPIANTQAYILDPCLQPVPIGVAGELYLSSSGLSRGYLNRPDLTAEKFIPNPFYQSEKEKTTSSRLYKTGDKARYLPDGKIEYLGRFDHQVKIRGYRIELGEIEAVINQYPTIKETIVIPTQDHLSLIAYIVLQPSEKLTQLRHFLEEKLPSYMIPNYFIELDKLPRLPNGKLDRKNLPNPDNLRFNIEANYVEPKTDLEKDIAKIWQKVLNQEAIGIYDNFFELGGHSLLGMTMIAEINELLEISIPLRKLFEKPTISGLIEQIETQEIGKKPHLPKLSPNWEERYQPFPLTDIQQAYLTGRNAIFELGNVATHGYREIETMGVTISQVEQALQTLIDRHDMLRMVILEEGQQQILEDVPLYKIETIDLRGQNPDPTLLELRERLSHQILDSKQWPLFEIVATLLDDNRIRFHISFDVLIGDAWSFQLLGAELIQIIQNPDIALPKLTLSFRDYVLAELSLRDTKLYQNALTYWQNRLATLPPSPELPVRQNLATITNPRFKRRSGKLVPSLWQSLKQKARKIGITPSSLILAAFSQLLAHWSRKGHFTLNLTLFNRLPIHSDVNKIIGDFTSSILLEVNQTKVSSFTLLAKQVQSQLWQDLEHRYVSGVKVLRELARLQGRKTGAIMPVVFTSTLTQNIPSKPAFSTEVVYSLSQTSQVYFDHQVSEIDQALIFNWDTIEDVFPAGVLDDMFRAYCHFLERLATQEEVWQSSPLSLLPPSQIEQITTINQTEQDFAQKDYLLHQLFLKQAAITPQNVAIITSHHQITYQELSALTLTLGSQLKALGAQPNQLIGIVMEKGWEQVVATLGILTSGAAYVPIDPNLPTERRLFLLKEANVQQILTQSWLNSSLVWPNDIQRICVDTITPCQDLDVEIETTANDLAYIIYTSGSTGTPKGVMISHQGVVNQILDVNQRFQVTEKDKVLALSSLSFDRG